MQRLLWMVQIVGLCLAKTSQNVSQDTSCPCRPSDECKSAFPLVPKNTELIACGDENSVRCCALIQRPVESTFINESSRNFNHFGGHNAGRESRLREAPIRSLIQFIRDKMFALMNGNKQSEEQPTQVAVNTEYYENLHGTGLDDEHEEIDRPSSHKSHGQVGMSILNNVKDIMTFMDANQKEEEEHSKEESSAPQVLRVRIINNFPTEIASPTTGFLYPRIQSQSIHNQQGSIKYTVSPLQKAGQATTMENRPSTDSVDDVPQDEEIIDNVMNFESLRVTPKNERIKNLYFRPMEKRERRKINAAELDGKDSMEDSRSNLQSRFLLTSKSVPEKVGNFSKQKTSLGTLLTLNRVSARAANENTPNLTSQSHILEIDDTLIGNLTYLGNSENTKRLTRSRATKIIDESTTNEDQEGLRNTDGSGQVLSTGPQAVPKESRIIVKEDEKTSKSTDSSISNEEITMTSSARRFRRPPRILPLRIVQNEQRPNQTASDKYQNSKQRTLDFFSRSNLKRKDLSSIIINRSDVKIKKPVSTSYNTSIAENGNVAARRDRHFKRTRNIIVENRSASSNNTERNTNSVHETRASTFNLQESPSRGLEKAEDGGETTKDANLEDYAGQFHLTNALPTPSDLKKSSSEFADLIRGSASSAGVQSNKKTIWSTLLSESTSLPFDTVDEQISEADKGLDASRANDSRTKILATVTLPVNLESD